MDADDNLRKQLAMTPETWTQLKAEGVTDGAQLRLDFYFDAPSEDSAHALAAVLADEAEYVEAVSVRVGLLRRKVWAVSGRTRPTTVSLPFLESWVTQMVERGAAHGAAFDGWGAQVP